MKKATGVNEWADKERANCIRGCPHGCVYCYAHVKANNPFYARAKLHPKGEWTDFEIRWDTLPKPLGFKGKCIMFPTSSDITPETLGPSMIQIRKLLSTGAAKELLIVSKPHVSCIAAICAAFAEYKDRIELRFSISSDDADILRFWEPHAPPYAERIECLRIARTAGFATSASLEPMLDPCF